MPVIPAYDHSHLRTRLLTGGMFTKQVIIQAEKPPQFNSRLYKCCFVNGRDFYSPNVIPDQQYKGCFDSDNVAI